MSYLSKLYDNKLLASEVISDNCGTGPLYMRLNNMSFPTKR